jgi:hypothetical protein
MSLREAENPRRYRKPENKHETKAQRNKRLAVVQAERQQLRHRLAEDPDAVLSFREWTAICGFSLRLGRQILDSGEGPPVIRFSERRIGISRAANREWLASRTQKR